MQTINNDLTTGNKSPVMTPLRGEWIRTLNVTDAPAHTDGPHCGSMGHVLPFPESCRMAETLGFDAVNADRKFLKENGPEYTAGLLKRHGIQPAAFAFSAAFNACFTDDQFEESLAVFEKDLSLGRKAGFTCCVGYVQPSSDRLTFQDHFRLLVRRLRRITPLLSAYDVHLGLEFIGPTTMRIRRKHDFIHTLDGIRSMIAAADAQAMVGLKLDTMHWYTSGGGVLDIEKLAPEEVIYVEINDGLKGAFNRFTLPEFERELPGVTGIIDISGMLATLDAIGFKGPVVVEPWNERLRKMNPVEAIRLVKDALDLSLKNAGIR